MAKFLIARLVYNDGLVTIFGLGGIYAAGTFDFTLPEVTIWGITISAIAGLGAFIFGFVDDRLGGKKTILISVAGLTLGAVIGVFAPNRTWFWVASVFVGIFAGPNQAASRSLMARFVPDQRQAEFFGFFAFSGKITAFIGPFLVSTLTGAFNNQRIGMSSVFVLFLVGGVLLALVNEAAGVRAAEEAS
jgi:UMF1 family MFS transporter